MVFWLLIVDMLMQYYRGQDIHKSALSQACPHTVDIVYDYNVQSKVWESVKNESLEEN